MSIDNPFFHRGAIRRAGEFHGRQNELSQILGLLRNGQSVSIIGPRRIGKSSLLLQLCRPKVRAQHNLSPQEAIFALLDCQELGGSPPEEVYEALLTSVMDAAASAPIILETVQRPGTYRSLDRILNTIQRSGLSVVILLDEFELLAANERLTPYFFARLRGLTTKYGIAFLTASQRPLFSITAAEEILSSPFFNIFVSVPLGLFSEQESQELLVRRLEGTGYEFNPALQEYILNLVGFHPCYLHIAGYHAFRTVSLGTENSGGDISEWLDPPVEIEAKSHLGYMWQNLSVDERYCLAIVDGPIDTLRQLEQQCLVELSGDSYVYTSKLLQRFVRRQSIEGLIQFGPMVIDLQRHQVHANHDELSLTTSQFDLLVRLGRQPDHVVTSTDLEKAVWGDALVDDPDRLKTLIKRLRRALGPYGEWIVSERGVGYTLREPSS